MKSMNTIQVHKTLAEFGLTNNEIVVYLEAIKHKEISPFMLARQTRIPRTTVYDVMTTLALKGLITIKTSQGLEKQQTWIVAKNPSELREIIFKRRRDLVQLEVDIVDILPDLKSDQVTHENNGNMQFLPGRVGVERAYNFIQNIPIDLEIFYFDNMMPMDALGKTYVNEEVSKTLSKAGKIKRRVKTIMPLNDWTRHVLSYQYGRNKSYIDFHEYRFIENPVFNLSHDMYVFADKVVTIVAKDDEIWASILTSKLVSSSFKAIFQMLWGMGTPITHEFVKNLGENEFLQEEVKRKKKKM